MALLPDLSGTVIESNAVVFDGAGMFVRAEGRQELQRLGERLHLGRSVLTCNTAGGGLGADCNGYPQNAFRYDTPTWWGFSVSTSYGEDDMWDVALKYAADWNSIKFSAAAGFTQLTDEGCSAPGVFHGGRTCSNVAVVGGGGTPFQNFRQDGQLFQVGASIMHVPSGLFAYGLYQNDQEDGTQYQERSTFHTSVGLGERTTAATPMRPTTWFVKAGIKRAWMPAGATVLFGEWGQYNDMFRGLCGNRAGSSRQLQQQRLRELHSDRRCRQRDLQGCRIAITGSLITGSEVDRWGIGVVQEIDSAAMHLFARWQHLELNSLDAQSTSELTCVGSPDANRVKTAPPTALRQRRQRQLRRSRYLPGWRRDLLLNEQTTFQIEAAPSGGFFFGTCACCRS